MELGKSLKMFRLIDEKVLEICEGKRREKRGSSATGVP